MRRPPFFVSDKPAKAQPTAQQEEQQCPVCLKLEETSLRSGECIACEACAGTCPKQNIHRWDTALYKHLWLPVLGKALLFFLLGCWLGFCRFI